MNVPSKTVAVNIYVVTHMEVISARVKVDMRVPSLILNIAKTEMSVCWECQTVIFVITLLEGKFSK